MALILSFIWGTVLSLPLHAFTGFLSDISDTVTTNLLPSVPDASAMIIKILIIAAVEVLLLILSKTRFAYFIPVTGFCLTGLMFVLRSVTGRSVDASYAVAIGIAVAVLAVLHVLKAEAALLWACDAVIYSISIYLATGLVFKPLSYLGKAADVIFYIKNYQSDDLASAFAGFLTLPGLVWGVFFFVLLTLPVVYYTFSRRSS